MFWRRNNNLYRNGIINLILLLSIVFGLIVFAAWLGYNIGINAAEGIAGRSDAAAAGAVNGREIYLAAISLAENAGLSQASGIAKLNSEEGRAEIDVIIPDGEKLPAESVLEAWLVDAGEGGGLGKSSVSTQDERYGTPFANTDFVEQINKAPYAHSLGKLEWKSQRGSFHLQAAGGNNFSPYDAVMITLESDGNRSDYDPRPGTPILVGKIE